MAEDTVSRIKQTEDQRAATEMVRRFAERQIVPNAERHGHEDPVSEPNAEQPPCHRRRSTRQMWHTTADSGR